VGGHRSSPGDQKYCDTVIPDFNACSANGTKSTGNLYFDVTGPAPTQVVYNNGATDLSVWT